MDDGIDEGKLTDGANQFLFNLVHIDIVEALRCGGARWLCGDGWIHLRLGCDGISHIFFLVVNRKEFSCSLLNSLQITDIHPLRRWLTQLANRVSENIC